MTENITITLTPQQANDLATLLRSQARSIMRTLTSSRFCDRERLQSIYNTCQQITAEIETQIGH